MRNFREGTFRTAEQTPNTLTYIASAVALFPSPLRLFCSKSCIAKSTDNSAPSHLPPPQATPPRRHSLARSVPSRRKLCDNSQHSTRTRNLTARDSFAQQARGQVALWQQKSWIAKTPSVNAQ
ncbi:hypothetical protein BDU57DRAFT_21493 [Ampelomyces quisqualis]|uniref:Uncharacterized protein n=1 Tax=Ampelomyces quisqualis TaxID=50730 RepID=A0A6A5R1K3_AMPQU|nr:hypothetical protein BDU57DRAFT_21493 [Ampelomyces quisqualis]